MAIKLLSTKFIGGATAGASTLIGGGFGINAAVNGGEETSNNNEVTGVGQTETTKELQEEEPTISKDGYRYFIPRNVTPKVKEYLQKTNDFIESNAKSTTFMLVKVFETTVGENYTNKSLKCSLNEWTLQQTQEHNCKLHLISTNLVDNNVGKILMSELSEITDATKQTPKDSYIVLELTGNTDQSKSFANKKINIKHNGETSLVVNFDSFLYKHTESIEDKEVEVLVPLKKNIHSFLIDKQSIATLFQGQENPTSFKCSYNKDSAESSSLSRTNTDSSCKIIKIDLPDDKEKTLITLDAIKKSATPFTKADLTSTTDTKYVKLDVDINKFYNSGAYDFSDEKIEVSYGSKTIELTISHSISEKEIQGKINWLIVKYRGEGTEITASLNSDVCATSTTIPSGFNQKSCTIHELEGNQPTNNADIEKISINSTQVNDKKTLTKNRLYAIKYEHGPNHNILNDKDPFYLYTYKSTINSKKTYDRHTLDIVALLMDKPTKENKSLLLSEITSLSN